MARIHSAWAMAPLLSVVLSFLLHSSALVSAQPLLLASVRKRAARLQDAWVLKYRLDWPYPPKSIPATPALAGGLEVGVGLAPHLEECSAAVEKRQRMEEHLPGGLYPDWACVLESSRRGVLKCDRPLTPWVQGSDEDNLNWTRIVQRDLWVHQFPINCHSPTHRFLVVPWASVGGQGLASQVHLMSMALALALQAKRILVIEPGTFMLADHAECHGHDMPATHECYFFPTTAPTCTSEAMKLVQKRKDLLDIGVVETEAGRNLTYEEYASYALGEDRVVRLPNKHSFALKPSEVPDIWGDPWRKGFSSFSLFGATVLKSKFSKVTWWRSQSTKFLFRWPSAYLCHVLNKARNEAFGKYMAAEIASADIALHKLMAGDTTVESEREQQMRWAQVLGDPVEFERTDLWRMPPQPLLPRPIVGVFVMRGKGVRRKGPLGMYHIRAMMEYIKKLQPTVHHIFISTEVQGVLDDFQEYSEWKSFGIPVPWPKGLSTPKGYINAVGLEVFAAHLLSNLIISSECDFFVGALGSSSWHRLVNELRMTSGRLRGPFATLDFWEE